MKFFHLESTGVSHDGATKYSVKESIDKAISFGGNSRLSFRHFIMTQCK
jgi:phosphopantetheinyl transferase (holo-ACP synthase)